MTNEEYKKQIVSESDFRAAEQSLNKELKTEPFLKKQGGLFPILLFELAETRSILRDFECLSANWSRRVTRIASSS
ncbi:hypothetical protein ACC697_39475, partial [Rhizobium ruizarguesonis]